MLTITPCLDRLTVASYCKKCKKVYSAGAYLYRAENRGELLAAGLFEISADRVEVLLYEAQDTADVHLFDGILRAGLNYAAEHGVENGLISEMFYFQHVSLFNQLNYPADPLFNITNFFRKYKNCKKQIE